MSNTDPIQLGGVIVCKSIFNFIQTTVQFQITNSHINCEQSEIAKCYAKKKNGNLSPKDALLNKS